MQKGRKIVYVLGAGASRALEVVTNYKKSKRIPIPIQGDFWDTYLKFVPPATRANVESFLFRYFLGYQRVPGNMTHATKRGLLAEVEVEEVFTFLSERSRAPSSSAQLKSECVKIWGELVEGIGIVFKRFTPNAKAQKLVADFKRVHLRRNDAIVSFNYDVVFETALSKWGFAYSGLEDTKNKTEVIKPHGSVNWREEGGTIVVDLNSPSPVVVAPTHLKFVETNDQNDVQSGYLTQSTTMRKVWSNLEREMKSARVLVFVGYSFPPADLYFSSVLRSVLAVRARKPKVVIVNPDAVAIADRLEKRFSLEEVVKYFDFQHFLRASRQ